MAEALAAAFLVVSACWLFVKLVSTGWLSIFFRTFAPELWLASLRGRTQEVRRLLVFGADIDAKGGLMRSSPLQEAALAGQEALVLLLLQHGADVAAKNLIGCSPLLAAAMHGHDSLVMLLLQQGAVISDKDIIGWTALHWAAYEGREDFVLVVLEHGADVSTEDVFGRTALQWAAYEGHEAVVRLLLEHGADVGVTSAKSSVDLVVESFENPRGAISSSPGPLHFLRSCPFSESHLQLAARLKVEAVRRAKCVAFAMGQQERLGAGSWVLALDPDVVQMVLKKV
jgi:hypothetical protein